MTDIFTTPDGSINILGSLVIMIFGASNKYAFRLIVLIYLMAIGNRLIAN